MSKKGGIPDEMSWIDAFGIAALYVMGVLILGSIGYVVVTVVASGIV